MRASTKHRRHRRRGRMSRRTVLVRACQHLWLVLANGVHDDSLQLTLPRSLPPNPVMLKVPASSRDDCRRPRGRGSSVPAAPHRAVASAACAGRLYLRWNAGFLYAFALERSFRRLRVARTSASSRPVAPFAGTLRTHPLLNLLSPARLPKARAMSPSCFFTPHHFSGRNRLTQQSVVAHDPDPPDAKPANVTEIPSCSARGSVSCSAQRTWRGVLEK
jgi:hypothetical protein